MKRIMLSAVCLMLAMLFIVPAVGEGAAEKSRLPAPYAPSGEEIRSVLENGDMRSLPVLDAALSLLEEGNPFLWRYNVLTGSSIEPRMPYGVPYLYGGRAESHVFAMAPEYVLQQAWTDSPIYYRTGTLYFYGFDCVGYVQWVWKVCGLGALPSGGQMLGDRRHSVFSSAGPEMPAFSELASYLEPGDVLVTDGHMAFFLGTLRQFGYTGEEAPDLAPWLDWPLVIHSTVHAGVADHFEDLIKHGIHKYSQATVTDGGVGVSLLGVPVEEAPGHVFQQKQDTWYFDLPDHTWLTVLPWHEGQRYCWYR